VTLTRCSLLLAGLGLVVSGYLTAVHYASGVVPLACATGRGVNCEQVTSSAASMLGPLPVAALGVLWFAAYLVLTVGGGSGAYRLTWAAAGLAFVFYLVYAELFVIGAVCLWCTAVHLIVVALFLIEIAHSSAEVVEAG
jgi:uncharacterized membrane protein